MSENAGIPQINSPAPDFDANSTHGPISLGKFTGKWIVLFSHPYDFTPVCSTEFLGFAQNAERFNELGVQLIGLSVDSVFSHIAWTRSLEQSHGVKIPFPVIADLDQKVARLYGMIHEPSSVTAAVRCVYFIDPKRILRAMIYYPLNVGRNFDEIVRVIDALQTADKNGVACPANWKPGDDVIVPAPLTTDAAQARTQDKNLQVTDWYLSKKKLG